jgi:uncharacterized membrane protein (DUF106 family)
LKKKLLILAVFILVSSAFLFSQFSVVQAQQNNVAITSVSPESGVAGGELTVTVNGTIETINCDFIVYLNSQNVTQGKAVGYTVAATFTVYSVSPGNYNITLKDVSADFVSSPYGFHVVAEGIAAIPMATVLIMAVAFIISLGNMGLNRFLITRMIGWHEYRSMQKEIAEYNAQRMAAIRAKNEKALEKLKKKDSQIQAMQTKMFKPQLLLLPMTAIYFVIWPILRGFFPYSVAYLPGFGVIDFFIWYMICSFFFGTIASRLIGVTPFQ